MPVNPIMLGSVRLSALSKSSINPYILAMRYNFVKHGKLTKIK